MSNTDKSILLLILRVAVISLCAVSPWIAVYLWLDPYRVIKHYDEYMDDPATRPRRIGMNKGIVTLGSYQDNLSHSSGCNAFIFGSSISCYYDAYEWRDLLAARQCNPKEIHPFHFDSASESPMSMALKVEYLHHTGAPIDYGLVILDPIVMETDDSDSPFSIDPVAIHREISYPLRFHYTFFRAAMNFDFLKSYIAGNLTGRPLNAGRNPIFEVQPIIYDKTINQETIPQWDSLIRLDPECFYADHPLLPPAEEVAAGQQLLADVHDAPTDDQRFRRTRAFTRIAEIFTEHGTDYEVIISPNRRGVGLAPADLGILQSIFGSARVHDFSYEEAWQLRQDTLLYDNTHYRSPFASHLMRRVYASGTQAGEQ